MMLKPFNMTENVPVPFNSVDDMGKLCTTRGSEKYIFITAKSILFWENGEILIAYKLLKIVTQ